MYILFCSLLTIVLLDFIFHHGGEWVKKPLVAYSRKFVHTKQGSNLIATGGHVLGVTAKGDDLEKLVDRIRQLIWRGV
nr:phosphoribosylamine--glycine ligase, chloroplastic-like isoform X5 [Nicotiana tomentosiformis]